MTGPASGFIVRALTGQGRTVGVGVLVDARYVITCAHVVNAALGRERHNQPEPAAEDLVDLRFALPHGDAEDLRLRARTVKWLPPVLLGLSSDDLAVLEVVEGAAAVNTGGVTFAQATPGPGTQADVFGYPAEPPRPNGAWVPVTVLREVGGGLLQLDGAGAVRTQPGFSGGPVVDRAGGQVLGLLAAAESLDRPGLESYLIPAERIRRFWPERSDQYGAQKAAEESKTALIFFDQVLDVARARHPLATITQIREDGYLRLTAAAENDELGQWPVGVHAGDLTAEALESFYTRVHEPMAAWNPHLRSVLVYGGKPADERLVAAAGKRGVKVQSLIEYQQLVDLRTLLEKQAARIDREPQYASAVYVPQRFHMVESARDVEEDVPLLTQVSAWVQAEGSRFVVLLGDFGTGKTFLMRELTRQLPKHHPPLLVELKDVEKAPDLAALLSQAVNRYDHHIDLSKLLYMVKRGRVVLLVDGFDELALRVSYDRAANHLRSLIREASKGVSIVLTSRRQHFISDAQVLNAFGGEVAARADSRIAIIEGFDERQILEFLVNFHQGDREGAQRHFEILGGISHLLELADNPQMLAFIAAIDVRRLVEIHAERGRTTRADIYREVIDSWLRREAARQKFEHGVLSFGRDERLEACASLALRLWLRAEPAVSLSDLKAGVVKALPVALERGYQRDEAAHAIGSGSLLVRRDDEKFAFVHQSVMEFLVASALADQFLAAGDEGVTEFLNLRPLTEVMVEFFCDLAEEDLRRWVLRTLRDGGAHDVARKNALTLSRELERRGGAVVGAAPVAALSAQANLAGLDLRGFDLSGRDLRGVNLREADLSGMRIDGTNLSGADLSHADFTGARLSGGSIAGANLTGSIWRQAALCGVEGAVGSLAVELAEAAVAGRDAAVPMVKSAGDITCLAASPAEDLLALGRGQIVELVDVRGGAVARVLPGHLRGASTVAFSPDGTRVATGAVDGTVRLWDTASGIMLAELAGESGRVSALAFSADREQVLLGTDRGIVMVWRLSGAEAGVTVCPGADELREDKRVPVQAVVFSGEINRFIPVIGLRNGQMETRYPDRGAVLDRSKEAIWYTSYWWPVAFSPDGSRALICSRDGNVLVRETRTSQSISTLVGHVVGVLAAVFSPDGSRVATACDDGFVRLWDSETGRFVASQKLDIGPHVRMDFLRDGVRICFSCEDGTVRLWDTDLGEVTGVVAKPALRLDQVGFLGADKVAVFESGSWRQMWDVRSWWGVSAYTVSGNRAPAPAVSFGSVEKVLLGSDDGTAEVIAKPYWTRLILEGPADWIGVAEVPSRTDGVWHVHRDSSVAVSVSHGNRHERTLAGPPELLNALGYSADGRLLLAGYSGGEVLVWDTDSGKLVKTLVGHTGRVLAAAFSPNGRLLATGSADGTFRLWAYDDGEELAAFVPFPTDGCAILFPDGSYKLDGDPGDTLCWAIKQCRFAPGELDPYVPEIRRLAQGDPTYPAA